MDVLVLKKQGLYTTQLTCVSLGCIVIKHDWLFDCGMEGLSFMLPYPSMNIIATGRKSRLQNLPTISSQTWQSLDDMTIHISSGLFPADTNEQV